MVVRLLIGHCRHFSSPCAVLKKPEGHAETKIEKVMRKDKEKTVNFSILYDCQGPENAEEMMGH